MKTFHILLITLLTTAAQGQGPSIALIPSTCDSVTMPIIPIGPYTNRVTYEAHLDGYTWDLLACMTTLGGNGTVCTNLRTLTVDGIDTVSFVYTPQNPTDYYLNLQLRRYVDGDTIFETDIRTMFLTGLPDPTVPECTTVLPATFVANMQPIQLEIWPNPCHDYVTVTSNDVTTATLYDIGGALVTSAAAANKWHTLNTNALAAGSYCLIVRDDHGHNAKRIIVRE